MLGTEGTGRVPYRSGPLWLVKDLGVKQSLAICLGKVWSTMVRIRDDGHVVTGISESMGKEEGSRLVISRTIQYVVIEVDRGAYDMDYWQSRNWGTYYGASGNWEWQGSGTTHGELLDAWADYDVWGYGTADSQEIDEPGDEGMDLVCKE